MKEHILVNKNVEYLVEELNMCQHLWKCHSHFPQTIINYVIAYGYAKQCHDLSVITRDENSLTLYSYPSWAKEYL